MQDFVMVLDAFVAPIRDHPEVQVALVAMLILLAADVFFGTVGALLRRDFSSEKMRQGIGHKSVSFGLVLLADVMDGLLGAGLGLAASPVLLLSCGYLCLMEMGSLLEIFEKTYPEASGWAVFRLLSSVRDKAEGALDRKAGGSDD